MAAVTAAVAAVYMRIFLEDDRRRRSGAAENGQPMLSNKCTSSDEEDEKSNADLFKLPKDMIRLFKSRFRSKYDDVSIQPHFSKLIIQLIIMNYVACMHAARPCQWPPLLPSSTALPKLEFLLSWRYYKYIY